MAAHRAIGVLGNPRKDTLGVVDVFAWEAARLLFLRKNPLRADSAEPHRALLILK